jgi:hypothetical protein
MRSNLRNNRARQQNEGSMTMELKKLPRREWAKAIGVRRAAQLHDQSG